MAYKGMSSNAVRISETADPVTIFSPLTSLSPTSLCGTRSSAEQYGQRQGLHPPAAPRVLPRSAGLGSLCLLQSSSVLQPKASRRVECLNVNMIDHAMSISYAISAAFVYKLPYPLRASTELKCLDQLPLLPILSKRLLLTALHSPKHGFPTAYFLDC